MKKIHTEQKIRQGKDGNMYYLSREIVKFNQTQTGFVAIYQEHLFDVVDNKIMIVETYPQVASTFTELQVSQLFTMLNQPILANQNFVEKFNDLQVKAMLIDTKNQTELGRYGTKDWIIYNESELLTTT